MEEVIDILDGIEDEDFEEVVQIRRGPVKIRTRIDHFTKWDEAEFFARYRMRKRTANIVLELIKEEIKCATIKNRAISPEMKFLVTLKFYASSGFLINVGDQNGIHKSTVSKIVKQVSEAIARLRPQFICMPSTQEEQSKTKLGFFEIARFPNCVGAIDCTHVKILSPGGDNAEYFRNRKGVFSINVQGVCDSSLRLTNIVARWPGSTHDAHIFTSCRLKQEFENGLFGNGVLVGDSGYACSNYLIPPLENPVLREEQLFQESQIRTRNPIERCFGVWKRRFPVLALGIRLKLDRLESVCVATAILHNICIMEGDDTPPVSPDELAAIEALHDLLGNDGQVPERQRRRGGNGHLQTRNKLIYEYFRNM
ncbi:putative nuclease HARBI1 [Macrosteles quadrilineatus]|uniref:putative nuclease HARBI1 n=2 Tax=Macrosteles quadrilineatus TaxID=74068 RepID=UPI0023E261F1|nr:putative nuclease HARBI1 [Macrosteles quadrilineatus]